MKKISVILLLLLSITGCMQNKNKNCNELEEFYKDQNHTYFKSCLDNEMIELNNQNTNILNYFISGNSIDALLPSMKLIETYKDGGSKIFQKENIKIIVCHSLISENNYNEDIIIGNENLQMENSFCKSK